VFDRYNIVSESDLAMAAEKLQAHLREQPKEPMTAPITIASKKAAG
jgi:hypothetical protein